MSDNENRPSNNRQDSNSPAVPFFVRYLERQFEDLSQEETESICGGVSDAANDLVMTLKFPSDQEDGNIKDRNPVTLKFPSDNEDGSIGDVDLPMTRKYPSDDDNLGCKLPHA